MATSRLSLPCVLWGSLFLAACSAAKLSGPPPQSDAGSPGVATQSLPLEVIGPDGTTVTVTLPALSSSQAAASALRLQVHALNFPGKATVQVNTSPPIVLANPSAVPNNAPDGDTSGAATGANAILNPDVTIDQPGWSYGGIGGAFATLSLTVKVPAGALHDGDGNTLSFTFHQTSGFEGGSIGYRVLSLNLTDAAGTLLLDPGFLPTEDPTTWTPPSSDPADIAAGESLWRTQPLQASPLNQSHILNAHCTDCHTQDGRDLQYFGFSNHSIIERAKFHGLTEQQGEQIASFIRTRPVKVVGRPWIPPFQPGPGLDAKPADEWAAGAGIEAAVADDSQTVADLFPGGLANATSAAVDAVAQSDQAVNLRQVRVALQLPDWNHWLPTTHPLDTAFSAQFTTKVDAKAAEFGGTAGPQVTYQAIRAKLLAANASAYTGTLLTNQSQTAYQYDLGIMRLGAEGIVLSFFGANPPETMAASDAASDARYSLALWNMVKQFELFLEFDQAELGTHVFGATAEARSWPTQTAGDASPHQLAGNENGTPFPTLRTNLRAIYLTSAWDYVQLLVNPGDRVTERTIPWEYVDGPIAHLDNDYTQQPEGLRVVAVALKKMTEHHTGSLVSVGGVNAGACPAGTTCWSTHDDSPLDLISSATFVGNLGAAAPAAIDAVLRAWLAAMTDPKYPATWWTTYYMQDTTSCEWDPAIDCANPATTCAFTEVVPGMLWRNLPGIAAQGADPVVLGQIVTLAEKIWPGPTGAPNDWASRIKT